MKKSQSISRKPKQKKRKTIKERIFLPKESKWEWFILGVGPLICLLVFYYYYFGQTEDIDSRNHTISGIFSASVLIIVVTVIGYTFIKEWTINIYVKYKNSQKLSLDDIGISLY